MKIFEKIKINPPQRSGFDLSHEVKTTVKMGTLTPVLCQEVLPSDHFKVNSETFVRMLPMLAPMMHRVNVYMHFFFVPNRIIWEDWEEFITGGATGGQTGAAINHPKIMFADKAAYNSFAQKYSVADYLGLPTGIDGTGGYRIPDVSQLPFRAYLQIYNDHYRDNNLITQLDMPKDSVDLTGAEALSLNLGTMQQRAWEKDYFTSALPQIARGGEITIPISGSITAQGTPSFEVIGGSIAPIAGNANFTGSGSKNIKDGAGNVLDIALGLNVDLSHNTGTINDLKRAYAIQNWLEASMRGGYRYVESLLHWFGVKSSDQRLQRAEFLGGGKLPITIGEVLQTSETNTTPQGTMSGRGIGSAEIIGFNKSFEEHGWIIGIMSIMPRTAYFQGIPREFFKFDRFDFYFKQFANIGEQKVYNKELYLADDGEANEAEFGYQMRYAEYRFKQDRICGDFRDNLDYWHMGRDFTNRPELNPAFINCVPTERIYPVEGVPDNQVLCQLYFDIYANRPLPEYSQPI